MQLVNPPLYRKVEIGFKIGSKYQSVNSVEVIKTEEKGSDVNLSTQILLDAFDNRFDVAVIISNDSDLATPVRFVRTRFNKRVIILNPHSFDKRSKELSQYAAKTIEITQDHISESQFPNPIDTGRLKIYKPKSW
tara:strand:- start:62958 stop:63362 length:405 start_codon:yes stop_codon:yes gene_type:complete